MEGHMNGMPSGSQKSHKALGETIISRRKLRALVRRSFDGATPEDVTWAVKNLQLGIYRDFADLSVKVLRDPFIRRCDITRRAAVAGRPCESKPNAAAPQGDARAQFGADVGRRVLEAVPDLEGVLMHMASGNMLGIAVSEVDYFNVDGWWLPKFTPMRTREIEWTMEGGIGIRDANSILHRVADYPGRFWCYIPSTNPGPPIDQGDLLAVVYYWLFKVWGWKFWLIAAERYGSPLIVAKMAANSPADTRQQILDDLTQLSADSVGVFTEQSAVEVIDAKATAGSSVWADIIDKINQEISVALLGAPDLLIAGANGSRSAVETRDGIRLESTAMEARMLWSSFHRDVLTEVWRLNADKLAGVPMPYIETVFASDGVDQYKYSNAISAGVQITQDEYRTSLGLPALGGEEGAAYVIPPQIAATGAAPPMFSVSGGDDAERPFSSPTASGMPSLEATGRKTLLTERVFASLQTAKTRKR